MLSDFPFLCFFAAPTPPRGRSAVARFKCRISVLFLLLNSLEISIQSFQRKISIRLPLFDYTRN